MCNPVTTRPLERNLPEQKFLGGEQQLSEQTNRYVSQRHVDTVEFTCNLGKEIQITDDETRHFIFEKVAQTLKPIFKHLKVRSNSGHKLIANDQDKFVFVMVELSGGGDGLVRVQLKGRLYNVGRWKGLDVMAITQDVLRVLDQDFHVGHQDLQKTFKWKMRQFDICQNFKGYSVLDLARNYYKIIDPTDIGPQLCSTHIKNNSIKKLFGNDNVLDTLETIYINLMSLNHRKSPISLKIYNKFLHLKADFKEDMEYWNWYRENFEGTELVTRVEMSFKTSKECRGIVKAMRIAIANNETINEDVLCLNVLSSMYKGDINDGRIKGHALRLIKSDGSMGLYEPLMKYFCTDVGVKTAYLSKPPITTESSMTVQQLIKRDISKIENKWKSQVGEDEILMIHREKIEQQGIQEVFDMT